MKLSVTLPATAILEREYIVSVILDDYLGLPFKLNFKPENTDIEIVAEGKTLRLDDCFFKRYVPGHASSDALPVSPLKIWDVELAGAERFLSEKKIPVLFGWSNGECYLQSGQCGVLKLDVFGSAFFLLSRYEEWVCQQRDIHDRFSATSSVAYREGFIDRPIVNEYIEVLWLCLSRLWPNLHRKPRCFRRLVSCDVDIPYISETKSWRSQMVRSLADLLKQKPLQVNIQSWRNFLAIGKGDYSLDPYYQFDWIMDACDEVDLSCTFFFIAGHSGGKIDGDYSLNEPVIRQLIKRIHQRGHEIGLHASYQTYRSSDLMIREFERLKTVCAELGVSQVGFGGRQHYLRWKTPETFQNCQRAGLNYDSTLGFADHAGFRCGFCSEYPVFDLKNRETLKLTERPLVLMESTVLSDSYMGLGYTREALDYMLKLKHRCARVQGDFTLLWHNSHFLTDSDREMYRKLISPAINFQ